jgi:hypothetical protein
VHIGKDAAHPCQHVTVNEKLVANRSSHLDRPNVSRHPVFEPVLQGGRDMASPVSDDRQAGSSALHCATDTRYSSSASRVAALRRSSREIVDGSRPSLRAISRTQTSCARGIASCSSSGNGRYWPLGSVNSLVDIPTPCRNRWAPTAGGTPTVSAAHSELKPVVTSPELAFDAALGCRCPPARSSWICQSSSAVRAECGSRAVCSTRGRPRRRRNRDHRPAVHRMPRSARSARCDGLPAAGSCRG